MTMTLVRQRILPRQEAPREMQAAHRERGTTQSEGSGCNDARVRRRKRQDRRLREHSYHIALIGFGEYGYSTHTLGNHNIPQANTKGMLANRMPSEPSRSIHRNASNRVLLPAHS